MKKLNMFAWGVAGKMNVRNAMKEFLGGLSCQKPSKFIFHQLNGE